MTTRSGAALVAAMLLPACAETSSNALPPLAVRDSAGIEIVESDAPIWAGEDEGWRLGEEPILHIGAGTEGDPSLQFARILGAHRLSDGGVAVVDAWAPAIAFFDASGALVGRFAEVGEGPGELPAGRAGTTTVRGSFTCGADTVYVVVRGNLMAYAPPGVHVRTFSVEPIGQVVSCSGERLLSQRMHTPWRDEPGLYVDSVLVASHDLTGVQRGIFDTLPADERKYSAIGGEGTGYHRRLFGGALSVHGRGEIVATGFGDRFEIEIRDGDGRVRRILRVPARERPVGEDDVERFRDFVMNPWRGNERERADLEAELEESLTRSLPAFAELHVDAAGNVWARAYDHLDAVAFFDYSVYSRSFEPPGLDEPRRWTVLQADGRYLGEVEMPPRFDVHEIGEDHVLGVWRDALDIEYVRAYPLIKPGR